ncbi:alpha/beta fold hydrolase [Mycoplasma procyoni]|uniref:alpha/beta fold hydrolase n=1 Tax=Mycoplasma procyoni TaxID=568784 RepID=UPI001F099B63|nr:alpha/beta hydrolase [Mycoplasma procyoni]
MERKYIKILNEDIFYIEENNNKPKVLFLHGFASSSNFAQQVYNLKNRDYDVVAFDFPGCGKSTNNDEISIEHYQKIAEEFVKSLGYSFVLVVGHSLGGASALNLVINKIVPYALLGSPINYNILSSKIKETITQANTRLQRWLLPKNLKDALESSDNLVYQNKNSYKDNLNKIAAVFLASSQAKEKNFLKMVTTQIVNPKYLKSNIKELYFRSDNYEFITGINDEFVPSLSIIKICQERSKNLTLLSDCGHALFFEKPEEINNRINFLIREKQAPK